MSAPSVFFGGADRCPGLFEDQCSDTSYFGAAAFLWAVSWRGRNIGDRSADTRGAMKKLIVVLSVTLLVGCKHRRELYCESDADCAEWGLDFCDLEGEYPASEGIGRTCIDNPLDAGPSDVDGGADAGDVPATCDPGSRVCDGDRLVVCGDDGQVSEIEDCTVGCSEELARCLRMEPSNDLGRYLELSASEPALEIPDGAVIDTTAGTITDADGVAIPAKTELLDAPTDGVEVRVFWASSVTVGSVEVTGDPALAVVAAGPIDVVGSISLGAVGADPACRPSTIVAKSDPERLCVGNAGGSFGARGGDGGGVDNPGTSDDNSGADALAPVGSDDLIPLRGGCAGGRVSLPQDFPGKPDQGAFGGAGGGALQLSSGSTIRIGTAEGAGAVLANGYAGGRSIAQIDPCGGGGGGSGGAILLEAPVVDVPFSSILLANGGGGSCARASGSRPPISGTPAEGGMCAGTLLGNGGRGGTADTPATDGALGTDPLDDPGETDDLAAGGGGGGSVGRIRINTASGSFSSDALISPNPSVGTIVIE